MPWLTERTTMEDIWPEFIYPASRYSTITAATLTTASANKVAMICRVRDIASATQLYATAGFALSTITDTGADGVLHVELRNVSTTTFAPLDDAPNLLASGTKTLATLTASSWNEVDFSAAVSVAHGQYVALVFYVTGTNSSLVVLGQSVATTYGQQACTLYTAAAWTGTAVSNAAPNFALKTAGGAYAAGGVFAPISSVTSTAINTGTATTKVGQMFTMDRTREIFGARVGVTYAANSNFKVYLTDENWNQIGTQSVTYNAANSVGVGGNNWYDPIWPDGPVIGTPGQSYGVVIEPLTANNITVVVANVANDAIMNLHSGGTLVKYSSYAGSWAAADDNKRICASLHIARDYQPETTLVGMSSMAIRL